MKTNLNEYVKQSVSNMRNENFKLKKKILELEKREKEYDIFRYKLIKKLTDSSATYDDNIFQLIDNLIETCDSTCELAKKEAGLVDKLNRVRYSFNHYKEYAGYWHELYNHLEQTLDSIGFNNSQNLNENLAELVEAFLNYEYYK
jgi:hypothetical protein